MLVTSPELAFPAWEQPSRVFRMCSKHTTHLRYKEITLANANMLCSTQEPHWPEKVRTGKSTHPCSLPSGQARHSRTFHPGQNLPPVNKDALFTCLGFQSRHSELTLYSDRKALDQTSFCSDGHRKTLHITYSQAFSCPGKNTTPRLITIP